MMIKYPEHEKLSEISEDSQVVGEFLDWLNCKGFRICELTKLEEWYPINESITDLLAMYFDIDQVKIENEKRMMIERLASLNNS